MIRKDSAEDRAIRGNGTGLEYMCPTRHFVYIFFNPVFQVSTAKNEINLFNNHLFNCGSCNFCPSRCDDAFRGILVLYADICITRKTNKQTKKKTNNIDPVFCLASLLLCLSTAGPVDAGPCLCLFSLHSSAAWLGLYYATYRYLGLFPDGPVAQW